MAAGAAGVAGAPVSVQSPAYELSFATSCEVPENVDLSVTNIHVPDTV